MLYNRGVLTCIISVFLAFGLLFFTLIRINEALAPQRDEPSQEMSTGNPELDAMMHELSTSQPRRSNTGEAVTIIFLGGAALAGMYLYGRYQIRLSQSNPTEDQPVPPL